MFKEEGEVQRPDGSQSRILQKEKSMMQFYCRKRPYPSTNDPGPVCPGTSPWNETAHAGMFSAVASRSKGCGLLEKQASAGASLGRWPPGKRHRVKQNFQILSRFEVSGPPRGRYSHVEPRRRRPVSSSTHGPGAMETRGEYAGAPATARFGAGRGEWESSRDIGGNETKGLGREREGPETRSGLEVAGPRFGRPGEQDWQHRGH